MIYIHQDDINLHKSYLLHLTLRCDISCICSPTIINYHFIKYKKKRVDIKSTSLIFYHQIRKYDNLEYQHDETMTIILKISKS